MARDRPRIIVADKIMPPAVDPRIDLRDPPIFLLQAAPTWAPGLPDGSWQRVPVGASGQVLTVQPDGSVNWSNSASGFANPMTTLGDLIEGGVGGTPTRFGIGSNGQVLTVSGGVLAWVNNTSGFTNPMTTLGDLIDGGALGAAQRIPIGSNGQVLTVSGGVPSWQNASAGFTNPMVNTGDLITSNPGSTPVNLGIGTAGQVLTVSGGLPTWQNSASGFANPMTVAGDIIKGGIGGAALRLGAGANNQVLTIVSGTPQWASGVAGPFAVVFPSGDTTGVTDRQNMVATWTTGSLANGGTLILAPGFYYVKPSSGTNCLSPPVQTVVAPQGSNIQGSPVCIQGSGANTVIYPVGAGVTGIFYHRTTSYGAQYGIAAQPMTGYLRDFVIDGSLTTGAAVGLDWGDGWGYHFDLNVVNFNTTGAIGVRQINRTFWTEKNGPIVLRLSNNSTAMYITTNLAPGGDHSSEYNTYNITMFAQANQQGVVVDGVNMGGSHMWLQGNMSTSNGSGAAPPGNIAALSIINAAGVTATDGKRWYEGTIWIKVEANSGNGTGTTNPYLMFSDAAGYVRLCAGAIYKSQLTQSVWNGPEFSFNGPIGDAGLATAWPTTSFPGLGNPWNNQGPNALVSVAGGTVSAILLNGTSLGSGVTSGTFPVQAGGSLQVNGTVAPTTFVVAPAALPNGYTGF